MDDLACRCRRRHEDGRGWKVLLGYILIKKAGEALLIEDCRGRGELYGELGVGCSEEVLIERGGAGDEELRGVESGERFGEGEALVKEKANGKEGRAGIAHGYGEKIGARRVEDESRDVAVGDG